MSGMICSVYVRVLTVRGSSRADRGRLKVLLAQRLDGGARKARDVVGKGGRHYDLGHFSAAEIVGVGVGVGVRW